MKNFAISTCLFAAILAAPFVLNGDEPIAIDIPALGPNQQHSDQQVFSFYVGFDEEGKRNPPSPEIYDRFFAGGTSPFNLQELQTQLQKSALELQYAQAGGAAETQELETELQKLSESVWELEQQVIRDEISRLRERLEQIESKFKLRQQQREAILKRRISEMKQRAQNRQPVYEVDELIQPDDDSPASGSVIPYQPKANRLDIPEDPIEAEIFFDTRIRELRKQRDGLSTYLSEIQQLDDSEDIQHRVTKELKDLDDDIAFREAQIRWEAQKKNSQRQNPFSALRGGRSGQDLPQSAEDAVRLETLSSATVGLRVRNRSEDYWCSGTVVSDRDGRWLILTTAYPFLKHNSDSQIDVKFYDDVLVAKSKGQLIGQSEDHHLALVEVSMISAEASPESVQIAKELPQEDEVVWTSGRDQFTPPMFRSERVISIHKDNKSQKIETTGKIAQGHLGGGLFNTSGELVGVYIADDHSNNRLFHKGAHEIRQFLELANVALTDPDQPSEAQNSDALDAVEKKILPATVRIVDPENSNRSFGMGTVVSTPSGLPVVVTRLKVLRDVAAGSTITVDGFQSRKHFKRVATRPNGEEHSALASLTLPDETIQGVPLATRLPKIGETLVVGCWSSTPCGMRVVVTAVKEHEGLQAIETTATKLGFQNRSGIFNSNGELVGIAVANDGSSNRELFIAALEIRKFLNLDEITEEMKEILEKELAFDPLMRQLQRDRTELQESLTKLEQKDSDQQTVAELEKDIAQIDEQIAARKNQVRKVLEQTYRIYDEQLEADSQARTHMQSILELELQTAQQQLDAAIQNLEEVDRLVAKGYKTQNDLRAARIDVSRAGVAVRRAELDLMNFEGGTVVNRDHPKELSSRVVTNPSESIYTGTIKRFQFQLEKIDVSRVDTGEEFLALIRDRVDGEIIGAWGVPVTNSIVIIADLAVEDDIRRVLAEWEAAMINVSDEKQIKSEQFSPAATMRSGTFEADRKLLELDVEKAESDVDFARRNLQRVSDLSKQGVTSKTGLDQAQQQFDQAQYNLRRARLMLERHVQQSAALVASKTAKPVPVPSDQTAEFDRKLLELDVSEAEAKYVAAKQRLDRITRLHKQNAISYSDVIEAQAAYQSAEINLSRQKLILDQFNARRQATTAYRNALLNLSIQEKLAKLEELPNFQRAKKEKLFGAVASVSTNSSTVLLRFHDQPAPKDIPSNLVSDQYLVEVVRFGASKDGHIKPQLVGKVEVSRIIIEDWTLFATIKEQNNPGIAVGDIWIATLREAKEEVAELDDEVDEQSGSEEDEQNLEPIPDDVNQAEIPKANQLNVINTIPIWPSISFDIAENAQVMVSNGPDRPLKLGEAIKQEESSGKLHVWDLKKSQESRVIPGFEFWATRSTTISPDGQWLLWNNGDILNLQTEERSKIELGPDRVNTRTGYYNRIGEIHFSPNSNLLALEITEHSKEHPGRIENEFIEIRAFPDGELVSTIDLDVSSTTGLRLSFTNDESRIVIWEPIQGLRMFAVQDGKLLREFEREENRQIRDLDIASNDSRLATIDRDGNLIVWDIDTAQIVTRLSSSLQSGFVGPIRFSNDSQRIAFDLASQLLVFDVSTGGIQELERHLNPASIRWSEDDSMIEFVTRPVVDSQRNPNGFGVSRTTELPKVEGISTAIAKIQPALAP